MKHILLMTSDPRFLRVAERLAEQGWEVLSGGEIPKSPCLYLFATGAPQRAVREALETAPEGSCFFVGRADAVNLDLAERRGISLRCLLEEESYREGNAQATAEGVLSEVIAKTPRLLGESRALVCGFGTCGSVIARLLRDLGVEVWVKTGERSTPLAKRGGFREARLTPSEAKHFDFVVNTVEEALFPSAFLSALPEGCVIFQVATGFSGLCADRLEAQGVRFVPLPALPGRFAPESEADHILRLWDGERKEGEK